MDLDIDLLRCFIAVAETGSFTVAGEIVGRTQSAVSQRVKRLEGLVRCRLLDRNSRGICLTSEGAVILSHAREMVGYNDRILDRLGRNKQRRRLRLGIAEDFIQHQLPNVLKSFSLTCMDFDLEVETGMSCGLSKAFECGDLDLVISKQDGKEKRGRVFWREPLVWICANSFKIAPGRPLPLVVLPPPCTYRAIAEEALRRAKLPYEVACTSRNILGVQAAVAGGLGVTVLGRSFIRDGVRPLRTEDGMPSLPDTEITLIGEERMDPSISAELIRLIEQELDAGGTSERYAKNALAKQALPDATLLV